MQVETGLVRPTGSKAPSPLPEPCTPAAVRNCRLVVVWIDWYAYHVARFRGLASYPAFRDGVVGIELVGGTGVHRGLLFRETDRTQLPVITLLPGADWSGVNQVKLARLLWSQLNRLQPEAVLVPGYYTLPGIAAALWAKTHGRRSILMTESTREDHPRRSVNEFIKSALVRTLFDSAIVGGKPHARYLKALGVSPAFIATGYDVVDNDFFLQGADALRAAGRPSGWSLPERYFLFVGRLAEEKNAAGLIDAFSRHIQSGGTWDLVIAGDGPLKAELVQRARETGCAGRVHFAGMKTSRQLLPYYGFAGCFILPSTREPWGLVVNEAMAAGLPVLVSRRCGCVEDLVQTGNGFVFEPTDMAGIQALLRRVESAEPRDLACMGLRSREIIAQYSLAHWARQVERCLEL